MSATLAARVPPADRSSALREQIAALADWVDVILLETFGEIESLGTDSVLPHGCLAVPISIGPTDLGYLLIPDDSVEGASDDTDLLIASYVATLFALAPAGDRTSADLGSRYRAATVDSLVSGHFIDADDAQRKSNASGLAGMPVRSAWCVPIRAGKRSTCSTAQRSWALPSRRRCPVPR